jgi:pimeloyl-ACP methyl ester carboxylesterase
MSDSPSSNPTSPDGERIDASAIEERGVIVAGQRIASAMNNPPRALLARAPLILLPSLGFTWDAYLAVLERLAPERRVFALNWPGFGSSAQPDPADFAYTPTHLAEVLAQWMDALGVASAVLLAGGASASAVIHFAATRPRRARALALVGPRGVVPRSALETALDYPWRSLTLLRMAEGLLTSLALGPTTEATRAIEERGKRDQSERRARRLVAMVSLTRAIDTAQPETLSLARDIAAPCAVMRGGLDPLCSAAEARETAEALGARGALEVTLPEAGHLPYLQQPERFHQALSGLITTAEVRLAERASQT